MTDTSEPTLDWATAPDQFRRANDAAQKRLTEANAGLAERDALAREVVMLKAGVDTGHPAYDIFVAGYTGELNVDDVKTAWAKIGGATPPANPTVPAPPVNDDGSDPTVVAALTDLQRNRTDLGSGGTPPGDEPTADPQSEMIDGFHEDRKRGMTRDQAADRGIDRLFIRAAEGDPRVVSDSSDPTRSVANWKAKNGFA